MSQSRLLEILTSDDDRQRNQSIGEICDRASLQELLDECTVLDEFRSSGENLYERVRALFFLYAIHRYHLPKKLGQHQRAVIPYLGYTHLLERRFEEAIGEFLLVQQAEGPNDGVSSALAAAYHQLGFQTLADQVRRSVRAVRGNQWMFRMGHPLDHPLRIHPRLLIRDASDGGYPILREKTPVRMDLTHCGWSDIFFLGMDYPEGAQVLNVSVDLGVHGRDSNPSPPIEVYLRVIDKPVLRLASIDLEACVEVEQLSEVFDFGKDYLGLLKAGVIAGGLVPPGIEGSGQRLSDLLARVVGPGLGLELVSSVNNIPKGSRLAVSTNLLAALIAVGMRATGQTASLTGRLQENERRLVAARAILGEWLGGSGGGWQDSGGVWPGIKLIEGVLSGDDDPEAGVSRGRLLPKHRILGEQEVPLETRRMLQDSLVLVHGGMAQNVGPILEMVTEKYLLRSPKEWQARQEALQILQVILGGLKSGDIRAIGDATSRNFHGPLQSIIPWASTYYTETLIREVQRSYGEDFWGFWMLGGMSGGGMGFMFAPEKKEQAKESLQTIMSKLKGELNASLPFAMEPVVYDFTINQNGTSADLLVGTGARFPNGYYTLIMPDLLRRDPRDLLKSERIDMDRFRDGCRDQVGAAQSIRTLFENMLPETAAIDAQGSSLEVLLEENGFEQQAHEQIRSDFVHGRIGLAQNRLPISTNLRDPEPTALIDGTGAIAEEVIEQGRRALADGTVAVVTLAGGIGSRWTQGAGVVKALHPFCKLNGRHRTFIETNLAKSRKASLDCGVSIPHVITTSHLTHRHIEKYLTENGSHHYDGPLRLSPGRAIGLRLVPTVRDLRFAWEEMPRQRLDEQAQKLQNSARDALIAWAEDAGEGNDYTDNLPSQCLHPVGHWYEVPNLLRNGSLGGLLKERPGLDTLMLHNIDTLGANVDPGILGLHLAQGGCLTFEMITRRLEDRGGGLAEINGRLRLVEGLAMPREQDEFKLSYYNSMTTWIDINGVLALFGLERGDLDDEKKTSEAVREFATKMPTYVTLKDVKKRWGHAQEDVFPVAQFEKLWGDMTALPDVDCRFMVVPRQRGQQLKEQAQLDAWVRDGSAAYVESICAWK